MHVEIRAHRVERRGGRAVELQEGEDPLARLGRDLGRFGRGDEPGDHVELAAAGDLGAAREIDRAQLDRGTGERANDGTGVARVGEQSQPRQQITYLRPQEERAGADDAVRHGALLEGDGNRLAFGAYGAHQHDNLIGSYPLAAEQPFHVGGHRLRLRALARAAPEGDRVGRSISRVERLGYALGFRGDHGLRGPKHRRPAPPALAEPEAPRPGMIGQELVHVLRRG